VGDERSVRKEKVWRNRGREKEREGGSRKKNDGRGEEEGKT
jgi:hypothetical protein